jgi:hypothetical protein
MGADLPSALSLWRVGLASIIWTVSLPPNQLEILFEFYHDSSEASDSLWRLRYETLAAFALWFPKTVSLSDRKRKSLSRSDKTLDGSFG